MSDNSNNVHFSGIRFICSPYLAIGPCFARADNGRMRAANESYTLKMNIIVILEANIKPILAISCNFAFEKGTSTP